MKVRYTRRALTDSQDIYSYLRERSPVGAARVMGALDAAVRLISENPLGGLATDIPDVRVVSLFRYPYRLFYRLTPEAVEILHIRHTARRPATGLHEPAQAVFGTAQG